MKEIIITFLTTILNISLLWGQSIEKDTVMASDYYKKGKEYYKLTQYDTAQSFFAKSSEIYLKYNLWDKYLYSEGEKANCFNLNYDFETAFDVLSKALKSTDKYIDKSKPPYAFALFQFGKVYNNMLLPDSALVYHEKALKIRESFYKTENKELAESYYFLNKTWFGLYDYEKAMYYNRKAYDIAIKLFREDDTFVIDILNDRGLIELFSMNHREAEKIFKQTLALTSKKFGKESIDNIYPISYLGSVYLDLGDYDEGIELQKEALRLSDNNLGDNHYYSGVICQALSDLYFNKREYETALEYGKKAIEIFSVVFGEKSNEFAGALGNVGVYYEDMKDFENAEKYLNKALEIYIEINGEEDYNVSRIYQSLGIAFQDQGEFNEAKKYYNKSIDIKKQVLDSTHYSFGMLYSNIGIMEADLKNYDTAIIYFEKAISIYLQNYGYKNANKGQIYNNMGDMYKSKGDFSKSMEYFQKAIVANHKTFNDSLNILLLPPSTGFLSWHDYVLSILSKAEIFANYYKQLGLSQIEALKLSFNHYKVCDSILTVEKVSAGSKNDKIIIANKTVNVYKGIVNCLMQLAHLSKNTVEKKNYLENAFLYSEKNKSSVLLEALAGSEAQKFAGIPDSLLKRERNLNIDIAYFEKLLAESPVEEDEKIYTSKLFNLNREYDSLISLFEKQYPKYHKLKYSGFSASISDFQKSLDKKTALISWFLTDTYITVYFISNTRYDALQVKNNKDLFFHLQRFRLNISDANLLQEAYKENNSKIVNEYMDDAIDLYRQLFPKKIQKLMKGIDNIIIIPDGRLSSIPFEALLTDKNKEEWKGWEYPEYFSNMPYLIKDFNISYSYSANLFYQTSPKIKDKPEFSALGDWLALAPVFDNDSISGTNLRTRQLIEKNSIHSSGELNTRSWLRNGTYISPLPGSEEETKNIFDLFESNNKKAVLKTHKYANEEFVKSGALNDFRFLHVATHGMVNESKPELSCILLAQDSSSTEDNILFSGEIYNLELNADLVVLSACETGLGKFAEGEGVIGLTRALLYAGCKNIIVSLWQVSDESTNQLMVEFYKNYFKNENDGFSPCLSEAKLKLIKDKKYAHPFFWSPFILIGK